MTDYIERVEVPEDTTRENLAWHLARYTFAAQYLKPGDAVLDAGCGVGYGARTLAKTGAKVTGCDISPDAVATAIARNEPGDFHVADMHALPFPDNSFNVIVCFEVLEHIEEPAIFLDSVVRMLRPGGRLVVSTPNPLFEVENPFHHHEMGLDEVHELVDPRFAEVTVLGQSWSASMAPAGIGSRVRDLDKFNLRRILPASMRDRLRSAAGADGRAVSAEDLARAAVREVAHNDANPFVVVCRVP